MDELRRPLFFLAVIAMALAFLLEIGSPLVLGSGSKDDFYKVAQDEGSREDLDKGKAAFSDADEPPGYGVAFTGLLDALVILTVGLMGMGLIVPERVHGRIQGWISLIVSLLVLLAGIVMILMAIGLLMLMVGLFLAPPFGTIAYLVMYGFFPKTGAAVIIGWVMFLKLCFAGLLIFAHPRFLQNKGLILIIVSSLLATFIVGLLHGLVPGILVSITDVIGAIIVVIIALIWAVFFLIFSVVSIVKSVV